MAVYFLVSVGQTMAQGDLFKQYKFHRLNEADGLTSNVVNDIVQDTLAQVWIATSEGLYRYQGSGFQTFIKGVGAPNLLHNHYIDKLYLDDQNDIWLMTDEGVARYSYQTDIIERFKPAQVTGRITSMERDCFGRFFFGRYESGIVMVDGDSVTTLSFLDSNSGINFADHRILDLKLVGHQLWALVDQLGLLVIDTHTWKFEYVAAKQLTGLEKARFFDLYVDAKSTVWVGAETGVIGLSYDQNRLTIDNSLSELLPDDDFIYMLVPYENKWQVGAESDMATYRNVPPGAYEFRVKSLQNGAEKSLNIEIKPPLWKTIPAYIVYMLILILLIFRLNRFSNSRMALRQKLVFEQELREKEQAIMQEKLRFYTNFSHELKTPLTLIQGPVNDLLSVHKGPQDQKYLLLIKKNTNIILRFINRMLDFRKIEVNKTILNVGRYDIKILAQEEAESFSYLAKEKGVKFGFYCQSELVAWLDLEKVQIIMNNLLSNAFKFTPTGKSIHFGVYEKDGMLEIQVKDEGVGINESELSSIFSPFYQTSNSYAAGGTGIGLALSKSFVDLHLGEIVVESTKGKGAEFIVKLPIDKERFQSKEYVRFVDAEKKEAELLTSESVDVEDVNDLQQKESEKMLLVVDDNKDIAAYIASIFEDEYKVGKVDNGKEAYDRAVKQTPDIIISDVMMPGMDGFEFCNKIKSNIATSHIPVIMVTAKDSKYDKVKGYEVGEDGYLTKPFSSEVLKARVHNLLKNREMLELRYESNDLIDIQSTKQAKEAEFVLTVEKMVLQMLEHADFSVPVLCKELGMSQSALYRKIKSLTGVSIQVFIRKIRVKRAAQMLLTEDMTVTEIAFSLEFADLKYFRKCFKEQFGNTPSEYKAKYGGEQSE